MSNRRLSASAALLSTWLACASAWAGSPKVLLYHHVSDDTPASTSVSPTFADIDLPFTVKVHFPLAILCPFKTR